MSKSRSERVTQRDAGVRGRAARGAALTLAGAAALLGAPRDAEACGACYSQSSESTIVNDHRMALSITPERTILWDQITYQGTPSEFAYVVPVRAGAYIEASNDAWFTALDAATRPIIMQPQAQSGGGGGGGYYPGGGRDYGGYGAAGGGGGGCCAMSSDSSYASADSPRAAGSSGGNSAPNAGQAAPPPVEIVSQEVVGPYDSVTVRSTDPDALEQWLRDHRYAVPQESIPIIADFVRGGFDFIAIRLRPGSSVRAMQPIRIVSPGADTTMPLRMMKIGSGAKLGITLWIVGEGRYQVAPKFVNAPIDFDKLIWDFSQSRSNYQELSRAAMATAEGRGVLTEYANRPSFVYTGQRAPQAGMTQNIGVMDAYQVACADEGLRVDEWAERPFPPPPPPRPDAGDDAGDADGGADPDAGAPTDAGGGSGTVTDGGVAPRPARPTCDDVSAAVRGMTPEDLWVTRLRMDLPRAVLDDTLRFEAEPTQKPLDNIHTAKDVGTITQLRVARPAPTRYGTYLTMAVTGLVVARMLARRRRR